MSTSSQAAPPERASQSASEPLFQPIMLGPYSLERDRYFSVQTRFVMTLIRNEQEVLSKRYQS